MSTNTKQLKAYRHGYCVDYDKTIKVDGTKIKCYSKKMMEKLYESEKDYTILGEIKKKNKKDPNGYLTVLHSRFPVCDLGEHSSTLYAIAGYVKVGEDQFVVILKHRFAFLIWFFGMLGGMAVMGAVLMAIISALDKPVVIDPDHPLPTEDPNVSTLPDDPGSDTPATSPQGGGSVSMIYTLEVQVTLSTGDVKIYFRNPGASNHDVAIDLYVISNGNQTPIAQSGLIKAGYGLETLTMMEGVTLSEGVYEGKYVVHFYNPETGERALVEPEITDLNITVVP